MLALAIFAILFLRLWALQVLSGSQYLRTAQNNQLRTVRVPAPRGPILDRYGRVLVTNIAGTEIQIWPADLPKNGPLPAPAQARADRAVPDRAGRRGDRPAPAATRSRP